MRQILLVLPLLASAALGADARWLRYPAISPAGGQIAFSYRGDLWVVGADGGEARPLTSHIAHENHPVWSPDGKWIAFASDRHGNFDVFLMPATGGAARRLTHHSSHDLPSAFTPDGKRVLFSSRRLDAPQAAIGSTFLSELYSIPVAGGRPRQELTTPALAARPSPDGRRVAYEDLKGYESLWRKHHVCAVAHDVWVFDKSTGRHVKRTKFRGEDRNPVWSPDGKTLFFLSERGGNFNVWELGEGEPVQVTQHAPHPVRFLSIAGDGTLAYSYNGDLFVKRPQGEPRRLKVTASAGARKNAARVEVLRKGATEMVVSPEEDEVAFVLRGEIFVASLEHGTTKRITRTPSQERSVRWSPDGRTLYFAAERGGSWNLYKSTIRRKEEDHFFRATVLQEEPVLVGPDEAFQPMLSPDGKQLAYLHNRDEIRLLDLATRKSKVLVPADRNYSYADGDIRYEWSPDGKWLVCNMIRKGRWIDDIGVVDAATGEIVNLTLSGYAEFRPHWSLDGKTIYFYSNRLGRRNHGSWGTDGDVFGIDLTQKAHDRARLTEEEFALLKKKEDEKEDEKEDDEEGDEKKKRKGKKKKKKKPVEPVTIEFDGREDRVRRLTLHSAPLGGFALSPDGEKLVYFARVDGKWDLWLNEIRKSATKKLLALEGDGPGTVEFAEEGDAVFVRDDKGGIRKVTLGKGKPDVTQVGYAAEMTVHSPYERAYIFDHMWRQLQRKFYDSKLHGVDWEALKANYLVFLDSINNNHDFAEMVSEMLGELNASHTGAYFRIPQEGADETASLGLLYDPAHGGAGLRVAEVLKRGPADRSESKIAPGAVLTHIDGVELAPAVNPNALLNRKKGRPTLLSFKNADGTTFEEVVKPIAPRAERNLLYRRWIRQRRELTDKLSQGRIGYVHVRGMNDASFRHVYQEVLGRHGDKQALIVDTRFNGGGNLHDDLVKFLGATQYATFVPRGKKRGSMGGDPWNRWTRPVVVVQNESNYSDAHIFPYAFKQLGIGKLIGTPVAGTGTAVWWERQIDPTLVFGIPQVGFVTPDGKYLENTELQPDVLVVNDPGSRARGDDPQLKKAVQVLLAELGR